MRLLDVDQQELDGFLVLVVELVERGNLPAKGRSGVAAEDEDDRLPVAVVTQPDRALVILRR